MHLAAAARRGRKYPIRGDIIIASDPMLQYSMTAFRCSIAPDPVLHSLFKTLDLGPPKLFFVYCMGLSPFFKKKENKKKGCTTGIN
jgi:hypothetical protein